MSSQANSPQARQPPSPSTPYDGFAATQASTPGATPAPPPSNSASYSGNGHLTIPWDAPVSSQLNTRSCVTCRRRKVRCDKHMPCSNCRRAKITCAFPAPGRAPRRPRPRDPNAPPKNASGEREVELLLRLRKLEGIVEELSGQIEVERTSAAGSSGSPEATTANASGAGAVSADVIAERERRNRGVSVGGAASIFGSRPVVETPHDGLVDGRDVKPKTPESQKKDVGRLVLNDQGKTRYVSNAFWSKINDELDSLRVETQRLTDEDSEVSEDEATPGSINAESADYDHHSFMLGYSSSNVNLRPLHPLVSQIPFMWQVFQENVDPLVKILHIPTMSKLIRELRDDMDSMTPPTEALMFSIYFAAITSMDEEEVKIMFGSEKAQLTSQYRFALEQALSKANFLIVPDVTVLQALVLFLVLVRRLDETRFSWTLTGLAIRLAHGLGLHRDGTHFSNLTPFEIEMRRRLWWAITILDLRSAEDQGTDLAIVDGYFDTKLPLNVNDQDISPDSKSLPSPRDTHTDCTFCIIRYEICAVGRRMHAAASSLTRTNSNDEAMTLDMREKLLLETFERVESKYLKYGSTTDNPMYWVANTVARLIMAKLSLVIHQPILFPPAGTDVAPEIRDRLFMSSMEIIEYNVILNTEPRCKQWRWLFQTYTQWHAVAYLLVDLCRRPWTPTVERAWNGLTATFSRGPDLARISSNAAVWLPLRKLFVKARRHRDAETARLRADPELAEKLGAEDTMKVPRARFGVLPSCVNSSVALQRWRKLVAPEMVVETRPGAATPRAQPIPVGGAGMGISSASSTPLASVLNINRPNTPHIPRDGVVARNVPLSERNLNFIDNLMAPGLFDPSTLYPCLANGIEPSGLIERARNAVIFGDLSSLDGLFGPALANKNQSQEINGGGSIGSSMSGQREMNQTSSFQAQQAAARKSAIDNPPPYLWSNMWGETPAKITPGGQGRQQQQQQQQQRQQQQDSGRDGDGDVSMDGDIDIGMDGEDEFDWNAFQASVGRFSADSGLGVGRGMFTGGL